MGTINTIPGTSTNWSAIRGYINSVIAWVNTLITNVTENANNNIFLGVGAGDNNDVSGGGLEGAYNTLYGNNAGFSQTKGYANTFAGARAGYSNAEGINNTGIGMDALRLMEDNSDNTAVGYEALSKSKDGWRNTAVGSEAMEVHQVGAYNVAFGYHSQNESIVGCRNAGYGYKTLHKNVFGFDNTALGYKALEILNGSNGVITAYADAGGGQITVTSETHGLSNGDSIVIRGSGIWQDHGYTLNYDGTYTISNVATDTFEITATYVAESSLAGFGVWGIESEGKCNTGVGYYAGGQITTGSYNICIGYGAHPSDNTGDYQLNIGDLITGDMTPGGEKWVNIDGSLILDPLASAPTSPTDGQIYFSSADTHFYGWNGTTWKQLDN